jgi:5-methylcytosine-specific restriction endonuclease McrA
VTPVARLRGRAGQEQRLRRLKRSNGLCEHCLAQGRTAEARIVNHIKALIHGGSDEDSNTENLCKPCDRVATAKQFGHQVAMGARGVAPSGRPNSPDHAWNMAPPPGGVESRGAIAADTEPVSHARRERFQTKKFGWG